MDTFLYFFALLFGYLMGIASLLLYQRLTRSTQEQEEDGEEGYTLTLLKSPNDHSEGA